MKRLLITLLLIVFIIIANGCGQKEEDKIELLFFSSDLPSTMDENIKPIVADGLKDSDKEDFQLEIYPMSIDKISIELAARNGDIYFVEQDSAKYMVDPLSFYSLDEIAEKQSLSIINDFKAVHPDTDETEIYAVPIGNNSLLIKKLGIKINKPLAALIPKYSEDKKVSVELLSYLSKSIN